MFLRATIRKKDGKEHRYWSVVENRRVAGGRVVQRHVLYLGEINSSQELGWRKSIEVLEDGGRAPRTLALFPEDRCEGLLPDESIVRLRLSQLSVRRPRQWGACWLALRLWCWLDLDGFWGERLVPSRKGTRWDRVLFVLAAYRLIAPGSEWRLHREWYGRTGLADLLGADDSLADPHVLYGCHDKLLAHKEALFSHLVDRWRDLFNASFEVLLYDLTSTYFESDPPLDDEDKRRHGYSRDHRPDCVQIVIALIVTPEGLPLAYEVLAGNASEPGTPRGFLVHGSGDSDRSGARGDACGLPAGALSRGHAQGAPEPARAGAAEQTLASSPTRGEGEAIARGGRALRLRREPRSHRQGTLDAPASTEVAVGATGAAARHAAHARCAVDEARQRKDESPRCLAARRSPRR